MRYNAQAFTSKIKGLRKALLLVPEDETLRKSGNLEGSVPTSGEPHSLSLPGSVGKEQANPLNFVEQEEEDDDTLEMPHVTDSSELSTE